MSRYDNSDWTKVGTVFVDSGTLMVGDPCYTNGADSSDAAKSWDDFLNKTWPDTFGPAAQGGNMTTPTNAMGKQGIGIVVSSGYGDGEYPVYIKTNREGRTVAVMVNFDDEPVDDEDDEPLSDDELFGEDETL